MQSHIQQLHDISNTLDPQTGSNQQRRERFDALAVELLQSPDAVHTHMGKTMASFAPGLFAGDDDLEFPQDNLEIERFFRLPKGHERRINGRAHAGVRIVRRGATLVPALDAHQRHPEPFSTEELAPWLGAPEPMSQRNCTHRSRIMRRARSTKNRPALLEELEQRYNSLSPER